MNTNSTNITFMVSDQLDQFTAYTKILSNSAVTNKH